MTLTDLHTDTDAWTHAAACRGSASFITAYHETPQARHEREQDAKEVCEECPVRESCLEFALRVREPLGIWGGLNQAERGAILARRPR